MANHPKITSAVATAMIAAGYGTGDLNGGRIELYTGSQPVNAGDGIGAQVKLVTLPLSPTAFGGAAGGAIAANAIGAGVAIAQGVASWFRMITITNTTKLDGSVGTSGCDLNLDDVNIDVGDSVNIASATISIPLQ
jgi:hypothetical protein